VEQAVIKYLIFGATGNIGHRVSERLIARGVRPSVYVRQAKKAEELFGDRVEVHVGDLEEPGSSLSAALAGVEEVFLVTDIADVATAALTARDYDGQSLIITGPRAHTYGEMAATIRDAVGKPVRFEEISDHEAHAGVVRWAGKGPYADAIVDIWRAVREGKMATVSDGVQRVLGRNATSFGQWVAENVRAFQ
jgi:uncharacterized protein YbjT (DUF2867 family)